MKSTEKGKRIPINKIAEVQELSDIKVELEQFKAEHANVFMQYKDLVDRYNSALEAAEKEVRSQGVTCGDFENYSVSVKFNAAKMFEELGEEMFLENGGAATSKTVYTVDDNKVKAAIASGKIPEECVDNFREVRRNYHSPEKLSV